MIKLIIFDWDDVFTIGSKEGYLKCLHETINEVGVFLEPSEEKKRIIETWGKIHQEELANLLRERPELLKKAVGIYEKKLFGNTFINCIKPVQDSNALLERLKKKYVLAIATGMHSKMLKEIVMPKFGIPSVFSQIISAYDIDDVEKQKPHPYSVQKILETQGVKPSEAVLVGDAKSDVLMARAAGIKPIVVLTGHLTRKEAEELGVEYIIESVTDLEKTVEEISVKTDAT